MSGVLPGEVPTITPHTWDVACWPHELHLAALPLHRQLKATCSQVLPKAQWQSHPDFQLCRVTVWHINQLLLESWTQQARSLQPGKC